MYNLNLFSHFIEVKKRCDMRGGKWVVDRNGGCDLSPPSPSYS